MPGLGHMGMGLETTFTREPGPGAEAAKTWKFQTARSREAHSREGQGRGAVRDPQGGVFGWGVGRHSRGFRVRKQWTEGLRGSHRAGPTGGGSSEEDADRGRYPTVQASGAHRESGVYSQSEEKPVEGLSRGAIWLGSWNWMPQWPHGKESGIQGATGKAAPGVGARTAGARAGWAGTEQRGRF